MNNNYFILFYSIIISFTISSCNNPLSNLDQITASKMECSVNQEKANYYYQKYKDKIDVNSSSASAKLGGGYPTSSKDPEGVKKVAFEKLSNVPEQYLEYIFEIKSIPVTVIDYLVGNSRVGLTRHGTENYNGRTVQVPVKIFYAHPVVFAHEFGHASEGYLWRQYPEFSQELSNLTNTINQKYSGQISAYLRSYTYQSQWFRAREAFAELFDTWYCSSAARTTLQKGMPEVYEFAQKYLLPPVDETKDINIYIVNQDSTFQIYFSNNKNFSNLSYCISTSNESCYDNKIIPSSFNNNTDNDNLFVSKSINIESSSFTIEVYSDDELIRKINISK